MLALILLAAAAAPVEDAWATAKAMAGTWVGTSKGEPGEGTIEIRIEPALGGRFLRLTTASSYRPKPGKTEGERHQDEGFFGQDKRRKTIVFRQFNSEGFVNQYVLDRSAPGELTLVTESIENIAPGWRARETYRLAGDELHTRFELAAPGKDFAPYSEAVLRRR